MNLILGAPVVLSGIALAATLLATIAAVLKLAYASIRKSDVRDLEICVARADMKTALKKCAYFAAAFFFFWCVAGAESGESTRLLNNGQVQIHSWRAWGLMSETHLARWVRDEMAVPPHQPFRWSVGLKGGKQRLLDPDAERMPWLPESVSYTSD